MSSRISEFVWGEPAGPAAAVVMFAATLVFLSIYVYFGVLGDSSSISGLFLAGGAALSCIAESLPNDRRRTAGVFRILALLVLLSLIALVVLAPEVINPR